MRTRAYLTPRQRLHARNDAKLHEPMRARNKEPLARTHHATVLHQARAKSTRPFQEDNALGMGKRRSQQDSQCSDERESEHPWPKAAAMPTRFAQP